MAIVSRIGPHLRRYRTQRRMSLRGMGEAVGVSGSAVSKWESGDSQVPSEQLPEIAAVLGVRICDLFGIEEEHADPARLAPRDAPTTPALIGLRGLLDELSQMGPEQRALFLAVADAFRREQADDAAGSPKGRNP